MRLINNMNLQKEYVLGQFYHCSAPSSGLVHSIVNRIWGRKCRIFSRKLSDSIFLFHIPDASTRVFMLQRGLWHADDCLMFVAQRTPTASLELPTISMVPVWITLKNIPANLYSIKALSWIVSALGEPMLSYKPRLDPTQMGEAKIMVEIELNKAFAQKIAAEDKKGNVSMIDVEYSWIPSKCESCGHLGHKRSRCLNLPHSPQTKVKENAPVSVSVPSNAETIANVSASVIEPVVTNIVVTNSVTLPAECLGLEEVATGHVSTVVSTIVVEPTIEPTTQLKNTHAHVLMNDVASAKHSELLTHQSHHTLRMFFSTMLLLSPLRLPSQLMLQQFLRLC